MSLRFGGKKTIDPMTHPHACSEGKPAKGMPELVTIEEITPKEKFAPNPSITKINVEITVTAITSQKRAKMSCK